VTVPISVTLPQFGYHPFFLEAAADAERLGFAGAFVVDHLAAPFDPTRPVLEGAAALGALAASTTRMKVGTLVMRTSLRGPAVSAAIATTAAMVAPGRLVVGLGVGDRIAEAESARFGFAPATLDGRIESLRATIALVRTQAPGVVVWVGGRHQRLRRVAAKLADGWNCWDAPLAEFVRSASEVRGWANRDLRISWGGVARVGEELDRRVEELHALVEAGADELVLSVVPNRDAAASWQRFLASWN